MKLEKVVEDTHRTASKIGDYAESTALVGGITEKENEVEKYTALVVDKVAADLGSETESADKHQINELTDYVDDLIKNAFKPEPVNIDYKTE